jgi:hypothetical protein
MSIELRRVGDQFEFWTSSAMDYQYRLKQLCAAAHLGRLGFSVDEIARLAIICQDIVEHVISGGRIYLVSARGHLFWRVDVIDPWNQADIPEYRFDTSCREHAVNAARGWATIAIGNGKSCIVVTC